MEGENINNISDLERLALLAKYASPASRRSTPKHDSRNIVPDEEPIIRCLCGKANLSQEMIQCSLCHCLTHYACINEDVPDDTDYWLCPFCRDSNSTNVLTAAGIDMPAMHHEIRNCKATGHYEEVVKSAQKVSHVAYEMRRAANWVEQLCSRDDVYDSIVDAANASIDGDDEAIAEKELNEERVLLSELSILLNKVAEEAEEAQSPVLDSVVNQIKSHPL